MCVCVRQTDRHTHTSLPNFSQALKTPVPKESLHVTVMFMDSFLTQAHTSSEDLGALPQVVPGTVMPGPQACRIYSEHLSEKNLDEKTHHTLTGQTEASWGCPSPDPCSLSQRHRSWGAFWLPCVTGGEGPGTSQR